MAGEPWQPRDLRRTAATLCARLGADPFVVALVLGHAHADVRMPSVTRTYLRWGYQILDGAQPCSGWNLEDVILYGTR